MKANAPKRKVFRDALDLLAEDPVQDTSVAVNGIVSIPVEEIHPFYDHPFRLYEGECLEDMYRVSGSMQQVMQENSWSEFSKIITKCFLPISPVI